MDPLAIAAVVGLVFAGKRLSENANASQKATLSAPTTGPLTRRDIDLMANSHDHRADAYDLRIMTPNLGRRIGDWRIRPKEAAANLQDKTRTNTRFPYSQPVYDLTNREYVTNKMNNVSPLEHPKMVGPGLGLGPDIPAGGGFQDYFRVLPVNVNEEKLTSIEGRDGPPNPVVKSGIPLLGAISKDSKASKTVYRKPGKYNGEGQGGRLIGFEGRPDFQKTARTTIRQETGLRTDTLSTGTARYNVSQPYAASETSYTDKSLTRLSGYRSMPDRAGNGARMNVRNDPVNQVGAWTQTRVEARPVPPGPQGPTGINRGPGYLAPQYDDPLNEFKENPNPRAQSNFLDIAIQQLEKNPLAYSLAAPPAVSVS
jgi:Family of unknown function (DUF5899)